ncbi:MAG: TolC family protein, partial [Burkholderiales bacterium]|nr:TolC family protein [Burkholderiales bacterium]
MIPYSRLWLASAALALSGCASFDIGQSIDRTNQATAGFTQGKLRLALDQKQKTAMESAATALLNQPLSQADAVHLALLNSPAIQAMLAQHWADAASAAQSGRIANPVFAFERSRLIDEVEIGRMLSFGLLDLLTLPQRQAMAGQRIEMAQLQIAMDVIDQVTQVRQAWVRAVAAQQSLQYARQVSDAAEAGAELAARMQKAGNFSKLQKERQQAFYADAMAQAVAAEYAASSAREALIRLLGLSDAQVQSLKLPEHFPDLPTVPRSAEEIATMANKDRLDIRLAQAEFEASARAQGLKQITSLTDIELGVRRNTVFDNASGGSAIKRGVEISLKLPVFDWG